MPIKMSRIESAVRVVLAFNEAFNQHDAAGMAQLMSADCRLESSTPAPDGTVYTGKAAITQFWQAFFDKFPHVQREVEEVFGMGIRCVMRWRAGWVDADGQSHHIRGVDVFQIKNERICEHFSYLKS